MICRREIEKMIHFKAKVSVCFYLIIVSVFGLHLSNIINFCIVWFCSCFSVCVYLACSCFPVCLDRFAFVLLDSFVLALVYSVSSQAVDWEERLQNIHFLSSEA